MNNSPLSRLTSHATRNRKVWDEWSEAYFEPGRRAWGKEEPDWGIWDVPESELNVLPSVAGKDILEFGCGTAYWSAWLARRGARVTGLDNSEKQLENARRFQREFGLEFPLIHGSAEAAPLPDASFDMVFSEYGASIWCDPYLWIPEASRLLRPGGDLIFLTNGTLLMLCMPPSGAAGDRLKRDYFGMHRFEWEDDDSIEFHVPIGEWIRILRRSGFSIEDLVEIRAPENAAPTRFDYVTPEWARRWPSEQIWKAQKTG